jgi:VanZ family protein
MEEEDGRRGEPLRILLDRRLKRLMFLLWWVGWLVVLAASLEPSPHLPLALSDKTWHLLGYGAMSAGIASFCHNRRRVLLWAGFTVAMGGLVELAQGFTPSRSPEWGDLLVDAVGAALGAGLALLWLGAVIEPLRRRPVARLA